MDCKSFRQGLNRLIDDRMGSQEKTACMEHMSNCNRCHSEYKSLTQLRSVIKQHFDMSDNIVLSPDFDMRFWARLEKEVERKPVWQPVWRPSFVLAGVFVVFFFLTHILNPNIKNKNVQQKPVLETESLIDTSLQLLRQEGEYQIAEQRAKFLLNQIM